MKHTILLFCLLGSFSQSYSQSWLQTNGPGGNGINALAINSQGEIFAVSNSIMKSTDNGLSWHQIAAQIPHPINIQIKPSGEIFVIENDYGDYYELWKSTDNGNTWARLSQLLLRNSFLSFLSDGSIAVTAPPDYKSHYFISTDAGSSWVEKIPVGVEGITQQLWSDKAGHFFLATDTYVYRSLDSGGNWSKIVNGISSTITAIAEAPNGHLFAWSTDLTAGGYPSALVKSTDGGRVWSNVTVSREFKPSGVTQIMISSQGRIVILSDDGYFASDDDGNNWRNINGLPYFPSILFIDKSNLFYSNSGSSILESALDSIASYTLTPVPNGTVTTLIKHPKGNLLAMSGGLWVSSDDGSHWKTLSGGGQPIAIDSSYNLLAGGAGINRSTDEGLTWTILNPNLTSGVITGINVRNKGEIFISSSTEGIFRSIDNGLTWDQLNVGISDQQLFSLAVHQNGDVYAGSHNAIFKSTDVGLHWTQLNTNFPPNSGNVTSMVVSTQGNIIAGIENAGVFWSVDNGATWSQKGTGLTASRINALVSTPSGKVFAATDNGIFFLDILPGINWIKLNSGLTATNVLSLCRDQNGRLFAGTDVSAVFKSIQTFNLVGQSSITSPQLISPSDKLHDSSRYYQLMWHTVAGAKNYQVTISHNSDFLNVDTISDLLTDTIFRFDSHYFSGLPFYWHVQAINDANISSFSETWSFQIEIPDEVKGNELSSGTFMGSNYPNPFSTSTTIPFTIGEKSTIRLEVLDLLGSKIAAIANGNYEPGSYEVKFNPENLTDGMYFVRLLTENKSFMKPILITK